MHEQGVCAGAGAWAVSHVSDQLETGWPGKPETGSPAAPGESVIQELNAVLGARASHQGQAGDADDARRRS